MRTLAALVLLASAAVAAACPWWGRRCPPPVVYYYPPCPPPVYYSPAPPLRLVEEKPAEPEKKPVVAKEDVVPDGWCHIRGRAVYDGNPVPVRKLIPNSVGAYTEDWVVHPTN